MAGRRFGGDPFECVFSSNSDSQLLGNCTVALKRIWIFDAEITLAIQAFLDVGKVVTNRPAVEAGLAFLGAGGDFADGVIAYEGKWLSGKTFASFDRKAVKVATANGYSAQWLT